MANPVFMQGAKLPALIQTEWIFQIAYLCYLANGTQLIERKRLKNRLRLIFVSLNNE